MTCMKHLGRFPCPRCLMSKKFISELGTLNDRQQREHRRIDSHAMRSLIELARKLIFQQGRLVNGLAIQKILANQSLTPICVRLQKHFMFEVT